MGAVDELLDAGVVDRLRVILAARARTPVRSGWQALGAAADAVADRPLRARVDLVRDAIVVDVQEDAALLEHVVRESLAEEGFAGWMIWPVTEAVAHLAVRVSSRDGSSDVAGGADPQTFEEGLELLRLLTGRLSAEFALRVFLAADVHRTLEVVRGWCLDEDEHVRRLASEGTRSFLPWGRQVPALHEQPGLTRSIVDALYRDESEYVRRSVGNHVNDLARRHPQLAVRIGAGWLASPDDHTPAVVRRAFRTLVKQGDEQALALLGFGGTATVTGPVLDRSAVRVGEDLQVRAVVTNTDRTRSRFAVDYVVHYRKSRGALAPKVFKMAVVTLDPGERVELVRRRSFATTSTRTLHPGEHRVELQVNGRRHGEARFELVEPVELPRDSDRRGLPT